jgi:hypothetical protein
MKATTARKAQNNTPDIFLLLLRDSVLDAVHSFGGQIPGPTSAIPPTMPCVVLQQVPVLPWTAEGLAGGEYMYEQATVLLPLIFIPFRLFNLWRFSKKKN